MAILEPPGVRSTLPVVERRALVHVSSPLIFVLVMFQKTLSYIVPFWLVKANQEDNMLIIDPPLVAAFAALLTSVSAVIWSLRRKP